MLELSEISNIGFGTYRAGNDYQFNVALRKALFYGCNVIDTAPNYNLGDAEYFIGNAIKGIKRERLFIMTKAGYLQGISLETIQREFAAISNEFTTINGGELYCIHPDFLHYQIKESLSRLKTNYIDGFFLHNPHYLIGDSQVEEKIFKAMEFLEDMVHRKVIRFYGLSSSKLSLNDAEMLDIVSIENLALAVTSNPHLKLFQFPLNIIENQLLRFHYNAENLFGYCRSKGYATFSNRPLNAYLENGKQLRLAKINLPKNYSDSKNETDFEITYAQVDELVRNQKSSYNLSEWERFKLIWKLFSSIDSVAIYFHHKLNDISTINAAGIKTMIQELRLLTEIRAHANMSALTNSFFKAIYPGIEENDYASTAIQYCKHQGVDCVLTGLSKASYIESLANLF